MKHSLHPRNPVFNLFKQWNMNVRREQRKPNSLDLRTACGCPHLISKDISWSAFGAHLYPAPDPLPPNTLL